MSARLYSSLPAYVGHADYVANVNRGFGLQMIGGMTARSLLGDLWQSIGTRSAISGIGLWHFVDGDRYISEAGLIGESNDAYRRYEIWEGAHAHTGSEEYADRAHKEMNRMEMAYGAAMEIRYNVQ